MAEPLRLKIGASVDSSVAASFASIRKAASEASAAIRKDFASAYAEANKGAQAAGSGAAAAFKPVAAGAKGAADATRALKTEMESVRASKAGAEEVAAGLAKVRDTAQSAAKAVDGIRDAQGRLRDSGGRFTGGGGGGGGGGSGGGGRYWHTGPGGNFLIRKPTLSTLDADPVSGLAHMGMGVMHEGMRLASAFGVDTDLTSIVRKNANEERLATLLSSSGYLQGTAGANGQVVSQQSLLDEARAIAIRTGTSREDVLQGQRAFVGKTGDLDLARKTTGGMAELSRATGTSLEDASNAAAEIANNLGDIPNKGEVVMHIMRQIAGQGKLGAVEMKDMASQMAKLASVSHSFAGGAEAIIPLMGVLAQESKLQGGSASANQAATSVMGLARGLMKGKTFSHWQSAGLNPFTDNSHTTLKDPRDLIREALQWSKGDLMKIGQLLPEASGQRALRGFANIYSDAGGGAKGIAAVNAEFARLQQAQLTQEEVTRAFNAAMKDSEVQATSFNEEIAKIVEKSQNDLLPAVQELAPAMIGLAQATANLAMWFAHVTGMDKKDPDKIRKSISDLDLKSINDANMLGDAEASMKASAKPGKMRRLPGGGFGPAYDPQEVETYNKARSVVEHDISARDKLMKELEPVLKDEQKTAAISGPSTKDTDPWILRLLSGDMVEQAIYGDESAPAKMDQRILKDQHDAQLQANALLRRIADAADRQPDVPPLAPGGQQPPNASYDHGGFGFGDGH